MSICVMSICAHSYPERNLHTARRQTRMPARHPHKIFAPLIGTATPNAIYTHHDPEHNLHTARRLTRTPAGHQRTIFAAPIGAATANTI